MEVCRIFSLHGFIVSFLINQALAQTCGTPWLLYDKTCFRYFDGQVNHSETADVCVSRGSRLISKLTDGLKDFLLTHSPQNENSSFWYNTQTGGPEGSVSRSNNVLPTPRSVSNPTTAFMSGSNGGKCYYIQNQTLEEGTCSQLRGFICEKDSISPFATCPEDARMVGASCLWKSLVLQDRDKAMDTCSAKGGVLANLDSKEKEGYGIVAVTLKRQSFWVGAKKEDGKLKWDNGELSDPGKDENYIPVREDGGAFIKLGLDNTSHSGAAWFAGDRETSAYAICEGTPVVTPRTTTTITTTLAPPSCPFSILESNGICYMQSLYRRAIRFDWDTARQYCQSYGGDLMSYKDSSEELQVSRYLRQARTDTWIGLRRQAGSNDFRWSDGSPLIYTNWAPGQPKTIGNTKLCVVVTGKYLNWEVANCHAVRIFMCKISKAAIRVDPVVPTEIPSVRCSTSDRYSNQPWYLYQGYCYRHYLSRRLTWDSGKRYCEDNGAFLASIHSMEELQFLLRTFLGGGDSWIGLRAKGLRSAYEWDDGTQFDFFNWDDDHDDAYDASNIIDTCVSFDINAGVWEKIHCNALRGAICKFKQNTTHVFTTAAPTPSLPGFCRDGWYTFGNKCYRMFGSEDSERKTWEEANQTCTDMEAQLVTIHSEEEQVFLVYRLLDTRTGIWIGMYGADNVFHWKDHSPIDFTSWSSDTPTSSFEKCVFLAGKNSCSMGCWRGVPCTKKSAYICETTKDPMLTDPGQNVDICGNPSGWQKMGSSCYMAFNGTVNGLSWLKAQSYCMRYAGNLAGVSDSSVAYLLRTTLAGPAEYFWIGIRDTPKKKYEMIGASSSLSYSNWDSGEPREIFGISNCVVMNRKGRWSVRNCEESHSFICEVKNGYSGPLLADSNLICPNISTEWKDFGGRFCYIISYSRTTSVFEAQRECFIRGGNLASFHSSDEVVTVLRHFTKNQWPVHIGLVRKKDGSHGWTDGSAVDYVNWLSGEPNEPRYMCVSMSTTDGKWQDIDCSRSRDYICSTPKVRRSIDISDKQLEENKGKLGVGGIIGIILFVLAVVIISAIAVYYFFPLMQRRKKLSESPPPADSETTEEI